MDATGAARRALRAVGRVGILGVGCILASGCTRDSVSTPSAATTTLAIRAELAAEARQARAGADVDRIRVVVTRPPSHVIAEASAAISAGQLSVTLDVQVELRAPTEELLVRVELWAGDILVLAGERLMVVDASAPINHSPVIQLQHVAPRLGVSIGSLSLQGPMGSDPLERRFVIRNLGGGTLGWSSSSDRTWLSLTPASGALVPGAAVAVTATARAEGMDAGRHAAALTIAAPDALESPRVLRVTLDITSYASYALTVQGAGTGSGRVVSSPSGIDCMLAGGNATGSCAASFQSGISVRLLPRPSTTSTFVGWSGACDRGGPCAVTMDQGNSVTALFTAMPPALLASPSSLVATVPTAADAEPLSVRVANGGGGTLAWTASEGLGWLALSPVTGSLGPGESSLVAVALASATLQPGAYEGAIALSATGAAGSPQAIPVRLRVTDAELRVLAVTGSGNGSGQVVSVPEGIACLLGAGGTSGDCAQQYKVGTQVTLVPLPEDGSIFRGWGGDACSGAGPCRVVLEEHVVVSAAYDVVPPKLGVEPQALSMTVELGDAAEPLTFAVTNLGGGGLAWSATSDQGWLDVAPPSGTLSPGGRDVVAAGVATSGLDPGSHAARVTVSDPRAADSPRYVDVTVRVTFERPLMRLAVVGAGSGSGVVASEPRGIECFVHAGGLVGGCVQRFEAGTEVSLTGRVAPGSIFAGWSGGTCLGTGPCVVPLDADRQLTATFEAEPPSIGLSSNQFAFVVEEGNDPFPHAVLVTNEGGGGWSG